MKFSMYCIDLYLDMRKTKRQSHSMGDQSSEAEMLLSLSKPSKPASGESKRKRPASTLSPDASGEQHNNENRGEPPTKRRRTGNASPDLKISYPGLQCIR